MATLDELQAQLEELNRRVNEITAPPDDYYTHRFSGEEIDNAVDRVKATPGSGAITAGDIGAAPAPLARNLSLYVNGSTGNDRNPGTKAQPFKTIQAAINSVPKNLGGYAVTIEVAPGKYDENVIISGFYSQSTYGQFLLKGATYPGIGYPDETYSVKAITVTNNIINVQVNGFFIYGKGNSGNTIVGSGPSVSFRYITVKSDDTISTAVNLGGYGTGNIVILNCKIEGPFTNGVYAYPGTIASLTYMSISGCKSGICSDSALLLVASPTYSGNTSDEVKKSAGQIFK